MTRRLSGCAERERSEAAQPMIKAEGSSRPSADGDSIRRFGARCLATKNPTVWLERGPTTGGRSLRVIALDAIFLDPPRHCCFEKVPLLLRTRDRDKSRRSLIDVFLPFRGKQGADVGIGHRVVAHLVISVEDFWKVRRIDGRLLGISAAESTGAFHRVPDRHDDDDSGAIVAITEKSRSSLVALGRSHFL